MTVDIDHLEAAIRIFDPEDTRQRLDGAMRRSTGLPRARARFILAKLREASGPLTSRQLADMWCLDRGLTAKASTVSMLRKRIGATLVTLHSKGLVQQEDHVLGLIGWRIQL